MNRELSFLSSSWTRVRPGMLCICGGCLVLLGTTIATAQNPSAVIVVTEPPRDIKPKTAAVVVVEGPASAPRNQPVAIPPRSKLLPGPISSQRARTPAKPSDVRAQAKPLASTFAIAPKKEFATTAVKLDTASFKGIKPGEATLAEIHQAWGQPKETETRDGLTISWFEVGPFKHVEASIEGDQLVAITIYLKQALPPGLVSQLLKFDITRSVVVRDDQGQPLGQAFPEKGVLFTFAPKQGNQAVAQVIIETIDPESFLLRAQANRWRTHEGNLSDIDFAIKSNPDNPQAHALRAQVLLAVGQFDKAQIAIERAIELDHRDPAMLVTRAEIFAAQGHHRQAGEILSTLLQQNDLPPHVKARGECRLGDVIAKGPKRDYRAAMKFHLQAIDTATPLATKKNTTVRAAALETLVDAHLGVACDIAWGDWQEKSRVVPKWIDRASGFAELMIKSDQADAGLRLRVVQAALSTSVATNGKVDAGPWAADMLSVGDRLLKKTTDPLHREVIQWQLGHLLHHATQIGHKRAKYDMALQLGTSAIKHLTEGSQHRQTTDEQRYLIARLHYRIGVIHAIGKKNHVEAALWYNRALPVLLGKLPEAAEGDTGARGETLVSIGVSLWQIGRRSEAIKLTDRGMELIQQAVDRGQMKRSALSVPASNLSVMHKTLGQHGQAKRYEKVAERIEAGDETKKR